MRTLAPLIAASGLLLVGAATAEAAWTPPEPVLEARDDGRVPEGRMPAVAYGPGGDAAIAWVHGPWTRRAIVVTVRGRDGQWDSPVRISARTGVAIDPRVAVDREGRTLVVWRQTAGTQRVRIGGTVVRRTVWVVRARWRDAAGRWTAVDTISPTRLKVGAPELAMDAAGNAVATWHWGTGTSPRLSGFVGQVQAAEFRDLAWQPMRRVSGVGACREERAPRVAMGDQGHTVVWWQCDVRGGSTSFSVTRGPSDRAWSPRRELPFRTRGDQRNDLGVSDNGDVTAISAALGGAIRWWRGRVAPSGVSLAALPGPRPSERPSADGPGPRIAVEPSGDALTAWVGAAGQTRAAPVAAGLSAGTPQALSGSAITRGVRVTATPFRRGAAVWLERSARGEVAVAAAVRSPDGRWGPQRRISQSGVIPMSASPRVAGQRRGGVLVAWQREVDGRPVVERAEFTPE